MTSHKTRADKCSWFPNMWSVTVSILCEFQQGNGAQISLKILYEKLRTSGTAWSSTFKTLHTIAHNIADKKTWNVYCHRHVEFLTVTASQSHSLLERFCAREKDSRLDENVMSDQDFTAYICCMCVLLNQRLISEASY